MGNPAKLFNTHFYIKKLEAVGVPETQAEVHAEAFTTLLEDRLATKDDLEKLRQQLEHRIDSVEVRLQHRIEEVETRLERRIEEVETKLERRIGEVETKLERRIEGVEAKLEYLAESFEAKLQYEIKSLEARIDVKLTTLKHEMIKWFLGSFFTQTALLVSLFKLFH